MDVSPPVSAIESTDASPTDAAAFAQKILSDHGEEATASHLQWLQREVCKLMRRELEVSRREMAVQRREAALLSTSTGLARRPANKKKRSDDASGTPANAQR